MGSAGGFGGASGVAADEADDALRPEIASTFGVQGDEIGAANVPAPVLWTKMPDSELHRQASQFSSFHNDDSPNGFRNKNSLSLMSEPQDKLLLRKSGKISRNNGACTKRSRMAQIEVSTSKTGLLDVNGISNELASYPASCNITEKTQVAKQRNSSNGKRGDRRNVKVHKSRSESFYLKNGLVNFNSAPGCNNFFGLYGLKPDAFDITKHVHELSFDELLDGSYICPSTAKDKGKKAANLNDILHSVRKVCSVLRSQKAVLAQKCDEDGNSHNQMVSTGLMTSGSTTSQNDGDREDSNTAKFFPYDKESCDKTKTSVIAVDSPPVCRPKDILERLALPPPKDLDSLLLDAKPASSSRNSTDPRLGKPVCHRTGLPPFSWSHTFSGHNKSVTDAAKLCTGRTMCQGRWVKVQSSSTLQKVSTGFLVDLESLAYNPILVPSVNIKSGPPENEITEFTSSERILSSSAACSTSKVSPADDEHSPAQLAAAQMLCEMATHSTKQNPCGVIKLPKKPSQMVMKTCKLKANVKSEKKITAPKSKTGLDKLVKVADDGFPSKKIKLSTEVKSEYIGHTTSVSKGPLQLSSLRSVKSDPNKLYRGSVAETKDHSSNFVKKSLLSKVMEKPSSSEQKSRKVVPMESNQTDGKPETPFSTHPFGW